MSVLIRGMEMPKSCIYCELYEADWYWCRAAKKEYYETIENKAYPDWCPLVPVPDHGRLIDADALTKMCQEMQSIEWNSKASPYSWAYAYESFEGDIDNAPTVIEAEEE